MLEDAEDLLHRIYVIMIAYEVRLIMPKAPASDAN